MDGGSAVAAPRAATLLPDLVDHPATSPVATGDALQSYLRAIAGIPIIDAAQEMQLARRLRDAGEMQAAQKLVMSNLRFVVYIARSYAGYGLPLGDLIQEGNIGLMRAVRRFDPGKGVRLISFAVHWIRSQIHEYVLRNWRIVKVATTKAQRKLFFRLRGLKSHLGWLTSKEVDAIAADLDVDAQEVRTMEARLCEGDVAFDVDPASDHSAPEHFLAAARSVSDDLEQEQWNDARDTQLHTALVALDERARDIVTQRWMGDGPKANLRDLAQKYGVSAERIRQIQNRAFAQIRSSIEAAEGAVPA
jgi:RNA polymerase sigma-32 factor